MKQALMAMVAIITAGLTLHGYAGMTIHHAQSVYEVKKQLKKHQQDYYKDVILDNSKLDRYRLPNMKNSRARAIVYQQSHVLIPKTPISLRYYDVPTVSSRDVHRSVGSLANKHDIVRIQDYCKHCKENCRVGNPVYTRIYNHLNANNYCEL